MEKAGQQLQGVLQMKETLDKIDITKTSTIAHLGSIVKTDQASYFLSISVGKLIVDDQDYFAVSVSSPIGKLLLGKKEGEEFSFNEQRFKIEKID
jgi:transcription elongation GreA/GreB family factor